jgi:hypothetical protein
MNRSKTNLKIVLVDEQNHEPLFLNTLTANDEIMLHCLQHQKKSKLIPKIFGHYQSTSTKKILFFMSF